MASIGVKYTDSGIGTDLASVLSKALVGDPDQAMNEAKLEATLMNAQSQRAQAAAAIAYDQMRTRAGQHALDTGITAGREAGDFFAESLPVPVDENLQVLPDVGAPIPTPGQPFRDDPEAPVPIELQGGVDEPATIVPYDEKMRRYKEQVEFERANANAVYGGGGTANQIAEGANKLRGGFQVANDPDPNEKREGMVLLGVNPTDETVLGPNDTAGTDAKLKVTGGPDNFGPIITGDDAKKLNLDPNGRYQQNAKTKKWELLSSPPEGPDDFSQIITGKAAEELGLDPNGRWQKNEKTGKYDLLSDVDTDDSFGDIVTGDAARKLGLDPTKSYQKNAKTGKYDVVSEIKEDETYRPPTEEERKLYQIPPDMPVRVNQDGKLESIGGTPLQMVSPETGAKIGLIDEFLSNYDMVEASAAAGDMTGVYDYQTSVNLGRGTGGQAYRMLRQGTEGLVRILTGAGMPESEARDRAHQYEPTQTDDATTLVSKVQGLKAAVIAARGGATTGRDYPAPPASSADDGVNPVPVDEANPDLEDALRKY